MTRNNNCGETYNSNQRTLCFTKQK